MLPPLRPRMYISTPQLIEEVSSRLSAAVSHEVLAEETTRPLGMVDNSDAPAVLQPIYC